MVVAPARLATSGTLPACRANAVMISEESKKLFRYVDPKAEAKKAWLSKLTAPKAMADMAQLASLTQSCNSGETTACEELSREEEAKQAWLARLDVPSWGGGAVKSEEEAKRAWLAKLEAPVWGKAATAMTSVVAEASAYAATVADCEAKVEEPCDQLNNEASAKAAWLAKLDVPSWGAAAAAVSEVAMSPNMNEEVRGLLAIDPTARTLLNRWHPR